jgi:hypothetical protein
VLGKKKKLKIKFITLISEEFPFIAEKRQDLKAVNEWEEKEEKNIYTTCLIFIFIQLFFTNETEQNKKNVSRDIVYTF